MLLRSLTAFILILTACGETKKDSQPDPNFDAALSVADQRKCNEQLKFFDATTKICEPYIDLMKECSKTAIEARLGDDPVKMKTSELDFYVQQKFEFYSCGAAKEGVHVILVQRKSAGEPGGLAIVKKSYLFGNTSDLEQKSGTTTNKETTLQTYRKTSCLPLKGSDGTLKAYAIRTLNVQPNFDFTYGIQKFEKTDTTCNGAIAEFNEVKGKYKLGNVVSAPANAREIDFIATSVKITAWSTATLSQFNTDSYCGQSGWQASVVKDVTANTSCFLGRNFVSGLFTVIVYEGGSAPISIKLGEFESNPSIATSAANRPTALSDYAFK